MVYIRVNGLRIIVDIKVYLLNKEILINEKGIKGVLFIKEVCVLFVLIKLYYMFILLIGSIWGGMDVGVDIKD